VVIAVVFTPSHSDELERIQVVDIDDGGDAYLRPDVWIDYRTTCSVG